jgi:4-hydroxy-tetrahydrodipicolinate synthase
MQEASLTGDYETAEALLAKLLPLMDALFCETSPSPAKYAMTRLGLCEEEIRLPLLPATQHAREQVDAALHQLGLI